MIAVGYTARTERTHVFCPPKLQNENVGCCRVVLRSTKRGCKKQIKALYHEPDGFVLIYKRLSVKGGYQWPRNESEVRNLTWREFDWLMSGIDIDQPKALRLE